MPQREESIATSRACTLGPVPADVQGAVGCLHLAAERLVRKGLDYEARVRLFRGIYYGTTHSLDFEKRRSGLRNLGFNLYLGGWPPADPTPVVGADLVRTLKDASEITHAGRRVDLGHIFVGLEARCRRLTRRLNLPAQGGTGLELATWIGDLGGAAGLLAIARMDAPATRARDLLFSPLTYDLSANLEGDIAAYLVARRPGNPVGPTPPDPAAFPTIPDALQHYFLGPNPDWPNRHRLFLRMIGGKVTGDRILDKDRLTRAVSSKALAFASFYLVYRLRHLRPLSQTGVREAARHVRGSAAELARIFVETLEQGLAGSSGSPGPCADPDPTPPAAPYLLPRILGLGLGMVG
jgi:hypothetical protein